VPRLCLALEEDRRTPEGRTRSSKEFREHFFSFDERSATDRLLARMPNDVRGPILAAWGVRGPKSAVRDTDDKVREVVWEALVAGDLDDYFFEEGLAPGVVVRWADLADWWAFWRAGPLGKRALRLALSRAHELRLLDAETVLEALRARAGADHGVAAIAAGLGREQLAAWVSAIAAGGDASPDGLVAALGWDALAQAVSDDALLAVVDAVGAAAGLAPPRPIRRPDVASSRPPPAADGASLPHASRGVSTA
jgi:hypothetical protein